MATKLIHRRNIENCDDIETSSSDEKRKNFSESTHGLSRSMSQSDSRYDVVFWASVVLAQVTGFILIGLMIHFCKLYGGFSWTDDVNLQFNWHPLLMILGLVFFYGDAIIIYRVFSFLPKWFLKILHASFHLGAIISASVGLAAVLENHRRTGRADFYSLHSWVGIATFALFCLQYVGSFVTFLFPGLPAKWRAIIMPFHRFFGIGLLAVAVGTAEMGLTEKLLWSANYTAGTNDLEGPVGNAIGLFLIIFTFLIMFIATHGKYKRKPLLNEMPIAAATVN